MLSADAATRLVYEPANVPDAVYTGEDAARIDLPNEAHPAVLEVARFLHGGGGFRGRWVDQLNHAHVVRRTVVKDVRALGITGLVRSRRPHNPVIILVRHPLAVAESVVALGWTSTDDHAAALLNEVRTWCEYHRRLLDDPRLTSVWWMSYEELRADPISEISAVSDYAMGFHPTWAVWKSTALDPQQPSATNFRGTTNETHALWPRLDSTTISTAVEIIDSFGFGSLYGSGTGILQPLRTFVAARA